VAFFILGLNISCQSITHQFVIDLGQNKVKIVIELFRTLIPTFILKKKKKKKKDPNFKAKRGFF
jgi:hypothetical protein